MVYKQSTKSYFEDKAALLAQCTDVQSVHTLKKSVDSWYRTYGNLGPILVVKKINNITEVLNNTGNVVHLLELQLGSAVPAANVEQFQELEKARVKIRKLESQRNFLVMLDTKLSEYLQGLWKHWTSISNLSHLKEHQLKNRQKLGHKYTVEDMRAVSVSQGLAFSAQEVKEAPQPYRSEPLEKMEPERFGISQSEFQVYQKVAAALLKAPTHEKVAEKPTVELKRRREESEDDIEIPRESKKLKLSTTPKKEDFNVMFDGLRDLMWNFSQK